MSLQIKNPAAAKELQALLKSDDLNAINQKLPAFETFDALVAILEMAKKNFNDYLLLGTLTLYKGKNTRLDFLLKVALSGIVPSGDYADVAKKDYIDARFFIISMRDAEKDLTNQRWGKSKINAAKYRFYPEYTTPSLRERICEVAKYHVGKGPKMIDQGELFSVGGMFGKSTAMEITRPAGGATTCILVARGIWHASGINVILDDTAFNVPKGLFAALPQNTFGYTEFKGNEISELTAQPGDIFHIKGKNFSNGNDSTHVGLIMKVAGSTWYTVEGGAGDHITKENTREIVKIDSGSFTGKLSFKNDLNKTSAGARPIVGWYSVGRINPGRFMQSSTPETASNK